jgi:hypothetical protein
MNKAVLIAAALAVAPVTSSAQELQGSKDRDMPATQTPASQKGSERVDEGPFKERIAEAIETVEGACAADIEDYCGTVPSGGGRLALCMLSHEDMLSARCRFGLYRATRKLKTSLGQIADTCLKEIRGLCGETGGIRQCLEQKKDSLSSSCQMIVSTVGQRVHRLMGLVGMPVFSSDNKNLGQVVGVERSLNGDIQSIRVDIGRVLGIGTKVVTITADKFERPPGVKLQLSEKDMRSLPEAKEP